MEQSNDAQLAKLFAEIASAKQAGGQTPAAEGEAPEAGPVPPAPEEEKLDPEMAALAAKVVKMFLNKDREH